MINKIVIVGGGFAGWYTACALQNCLPNIQLTVVDSAKHPQLGVGEATGFDAPINFKRLLGFKNDHEFMRQTGAVYKFGIQTNNFWQDNSTIYFNKFHNLKLSALTQFFNQYEYPEYNEPWSEKPGDIGTLESWLVINKNSNKTYDDYIQETSDVFHFCANNWAPYTDADGPGDGRFVLRHEDGWSYLFDAEKTSVFLKDLVYQRNQGNLEHISVAVCDIEKNPDGSIKNLILEDNRKITADLYIDCSGLKRVLVKEVNDTWMSAGSEFNNAAWAAPTMYNNPAEQMAGATHFVGEDQGWRFRIRLYHRIGNGYVFNENITNSNVTHDQFISAIGENNLLADPKLIRWEPGLYNDMWKHNVIALGLSSGLIDPFDSPTFDLHSRALEQVIGMIKNNNVDVKLFNRKHQEAAEERELRLKLSFGLSQRSGEWWDNWRAIALRDKYVDQLRDIITRQQKHLEERLPWFWHHMYIRLCIINKIDYSQWDLKSITPEDAEMAEAYFTYQRARNKFIKSRPWPNYYQWLKKNRFCNLTSQEILSELNPMLAKNT